MTRRGLLALAVAAVAACREPAPPAAVQPRTQPTCAPATVAPVAEPDTNAKLVPFTGQMMLVERTTMGAALAEVGLDVKALPPLDKLDRKQLGVVMKTFAASLGLKCIGCHDLADYKKPSPRKHATRRMWNDFVRVLATDDGAPIYCDSCHQGAVQLLDRRDKALVVSFMEDVYLGRLKRIDGKEHECSTCHGDPPDFKFLTTWRAGKK